ncbi:MAG: hypothetical protein IH986_11285 [Planctomycetes bacterium]|nr:hypothetical protein [Planctomycetota bacterium]
MMRPAHLLTTLVLCSAALADNTVRIKNLKTLCVVYRGDPKAENHMSEHDVVMAQKGVELGRLFYFRNSLAKLNCAIDWIVVDGAPPDTSGPTMRHIEADLRERGVTPGQYDGVFVTGVGLSGNFGGFTILDGTAGCFGGHSVRGGLTWYPEDDRDTAYGTAWNFVHEYQHAIDLVIAENSGRKDLLHAHPYADRNEKFFKGYYPGGEHWDWIACTFREFDGWLELKGVTNSFLECADADGDGMPDDDARLPMDEKRFGSDTTKRDTDGDGLDDLGEFTAGRYRGADPAKADTDADGTNDARDRHPIQPVAATLPYSPGGGSSDSVGPLSRGVFARNDVGGDISVRGAWNEDGLYFDFVGPRKFTVYAKIDGSPASGFWEGGDTYLLRIADQKVELAGLGLKGAAFGSMALGGPRPDGSWGLFAHLFAKLGQGVSKEINYGGKREPQDVVDGLTLVEGRSIAFNFIFEFEDGTRACLTPHHTMYAVKLVKPADAPVKPILRAPKQTSDAEPVVEVLGVRPDSVVEVVWAVPTTPVLGRRVGPGPVRLTKLAELGPMMRSAANSAAAAHEQERGPMISKRGAFRAVLQARVGGALSNKTEMVVDRAADPPRLSRDGSNLRIESEPNAEIEVWWGVGDVRVAPLAGMRGDDAGVAGLAIEQALLKGWLVTAFEGSRFEKRMFTESWQTIDRNFKGKRPDPRLPADGFSYRFEGWLVIDAPGRYTLELASDDGSRLWIDDELVINHWGHHGLSAKRTTVELAKGPHAIRMDYYELDGWAGIQLRGGPAGGELTFDLPIHRCPLPLDEITLFSRQTDRLGNRSAFAAVEMKSGL